MNKWVNRKEKKQVSLFLCFSRKKGNLKQTIKNVLVLGLESSLNLPKTLSTILNIAIINIKTLYTLPPSISASSGLVMSRSLSRYTINAPRKANR